MTSATKPSALTIEELESLIKQVEPAALLVAPRLLRRVIKHDRKIGGLGLWVPHRKGYVLSRESLLCCVLPAELGLAPGADLPPHVYLLIRPDESRLARESFAHTALKHWRMLFHLRIDRAMDEKLANGSLTRGIARMRIRQLGLTEFAEITDVLRQEGYLLPPATSESVYAEFVAVYLALRRFDPERVAHFFPALRDLAAVDALVSQDIDAEAIYEQTRLAGVEEDKETRRQGDKETGVNSAIVDESSSSAAAGLVERLKAAFRLSDVDADGWRSALGPLLAQAAPGARSQETRLLYDLESACVDSEQTIYTVDLVEWAMSLGQLAIRRPLPGHQDIVVVRHLRRARDRVRRVRLDDGARQRLGQILGDVVEHQERRIRERFRPLIASALDEVGLKPICVVEEVGRAKLIEELLDRVVEHGRLNIGNLRDALSRNQMKLPDLRSPAELIQGDPLIRLNRLLAVSLDGVYRRGEFYMRLLHRLSSVAFGTGIGRLIVLFLILPFGLAFFVMITPGIAVEEGEKLIHWIGQLIGTIEKPAEGSVPKEAPEFPMPDLWGVAGLGVFFVLLFNVASFRRRFFACVGWTAHGVHAGCVWLIDLPPLQAILHNRFWTPFRRLVFWPTLAATISGLTAWRYDLGTPSSVAIAAGFLTLVIVLLNTRLGRAVEETVFDRLLQCWAWFSTSFVPGLLHWIMDLSRWCLEAVEWMLYTVNEWLRFRNGENRAVIAVKAGLGVLAFGVTYVIRFAVNLLIEPQVNPIKHFPVVTVSHKVCLPMIPTLADILRNAGVHPATPSATGIIFGIPGIFGFMVWELKENWKLYSSNRAKELKPVAIGSHGETLLRLLHPGFHSGTIPKLYQKLRRAERHGDRRGIRKGTAALHHVAEGVAHFIEREMLALLRRSKAWSGLGVEVASIRLATSRVVVELRCDALGEEPLMFAFDHQHGWLLAGVLQAGWLPRLSVEQRQTLTAALPGLYKLAGVDLRREKIEEALPKTTFAYEISEDGLVVWADADAVHDAVYNLGAGPEVTPEARTGVLAAGMPALNTTGLLLCDTTLTWRDWVQTWEAAR